MLSRYYLFKDPFDIGQDVVIPESQHLKTLTFEPSVSFGVVFGFGVPASIGLNDYLPFVTDKIDDIPVYWFLPPELETLEPL